MPKLPFAGFTGQAGGARPAGAGSVPSVSPRAFGIAIGQATQELGRTVSNIGNMLIRRENEREARLVQVESSKVSAQFAADLDNAVQTGGDFEAVQQKHMDALDQISDGIQTPGGSAALDLTRARAEERFGGAVRQAESKRVGLETKQQTNEFLNLQGANVQNDPTSLASSLEESDAFIDSFSQLSPEQANLVKQSAAGTLTVSAAEGMLRKDPLALKEVLEAGGLTDLTPPQRAAFLSRSDSELRRREKTARSQDEMAKLLTRQELDAEAGDHVLKNEEAPDWFDKGVTASQFASAQAQSVERAEARDVLEKNTQEILAGRGVALNQRDYENALERLIQDATQGMEPEMAAVSAMNARVQTAVANGRQDSKLTAHLNAGPAGGKTAFEAGVNLYNQIENQSPELLHQMLDGNARTWYSAYDFQVTQMGIDPALARDNMFTAAANRKEAEARLNSKENKELIKDSVDVNFDGQAAIVKKQIKDRAAQYMALVTTLTPEQAVGLSAKDFEDSTVEIGQGVRAPVTGVPIKWEPADRYVRHSKLKRDFKEAGVDVPNDELDDVIFIPHGDGTVAVIDGNTNLTIFPNWNWQEAVDEWWLTIGQADIEIENKKVMEREAERVGRFKEKNKETARRMAEIGGQSVLGVPGL